jgi:hypothetical protein
MFMCKTENLTFGIMDVAKQTDFIPNTRKLFSLQLLGDGNDSCIRNFRLSELLYRIFKAIYME